MENTIRQSKGIRLYLDEFLFLLSWVAKAFYTQKSGGMQIADYIFIVSFLCLIVNNKDELSTLINEKDRYLMIFILCVAFINVIYFVWYVDVVFLYSTSYFLFNFFVVIEFRILAKRNGFLNRFFALTFLCLCIQLMIFFTGKGKIYGGERYMGTFNDPNQFAFFVMSRFFILYIINNGSDDDLGRKLIVFFAFVASLFLIVKAASTGMLLGMGVLVVWWLLDSCVGEHGSTKKIVITIALIVIVLFIIFGGDKIIFKTQFISSRLQQKISKMFGPNGLDGYIEDRNLGAFFSKPYYVIFGAGEGGWNRFLDVSAGYGELHSTILGLLFYYGIVPYVCLLMWGCKNIKYAKRSEICVYIALFVEMLTLINHRQSSLWILLILPSILFNLRKSKEND